MMAVWVSSGALLLLLLTGASYSYPAKTGFDSGSYHGPHYGANPASAGSSWEVPSSGHAAVSSSGVSFPSISAPAELAEPSYPEPSAPEVTEAAPDTAEVYVAPEYVPSGPAPPANYQPAAEPDFTWAVPPPVFSEASSRPSFHRIVDNKPAPIEAPSNVSPPVYPLYQAGELSHREDTYEHGNYESETEEQSFLPQPPPPPPGPMVAASNAAPPQNMVGDWVRLPYPYNYMFLTGQYPPGTYTHQSSSLEHGHDYWQDTHYVRDYYPAEPVVEVAPLPAAVQEPQIVEPPAQEPGWQQPSRPVQQPSRPVQQPSRPVQQPSRPVQQPSRPVQQPSRPVQQPSRPVQQPSRPVQQPSRPVQQPSRPVQQPSRPVQQPSRPVQQPSRPVQQPSRPVQQPSRPVQQPSRPVQQPSRPQWPSRPVHQPERSVGLGQTAMTGPKQPYRAAGLQHAFQY